MKLWLILSLVAVFGSGVLSDTPANCTYEDVRGIWHFYEGPRNQKGSTIKCSGFSLNQAKHVTTVNLQFPNIATDEFGNKGTWTLIYNQGFEVIVNSRKYFAFSNYTGTGQHAISYCHSTLPGWSHDVLSRDWACYIGKKATSDKEEEHVREGQQEVDNRIFTPNVEFIQKINSVQNSWTAVDYPQFHGKSLDYMIKMAGGPNSRNIRKPGTRKATLEELKMASNLPENFDWRKVNGQNFVSPVRNQGGCGSCFAFASMAALEAGTRILSNNTDTPVFSPQDVLDCSFYQQGCMGGFAYLTEGKYAEDFGVVLEHCNPYKGEDTGKCETDKTCRRYYSTNYSYVGGYYGGCNEELMRLELVNNGPFAVGFEVYNDFVGYSGGIYHHTFLTDEINDFSKFNPFQLTNHAVLIVGYGVDQKSGQKFWTVKNSWGEDWGLNGYFMIRRGNDECGIESVAFRATAIPSY